MKNIKKTLFAFLSLSLLTACGVGNSDVSSILSSITGNNSSTSTDGGTTTSSTSKGTSSTSTSTSTSTSASIPDGKLTKAQLLTIATVNAAHTFGEVSATSSTTVGTTSTNETIVTQSKGNEVKAVTTTSDYVNTGYVLLKDNVIKVVNTYDIKNKNDETADLSSTATTLKVVTSGEIKQGEITNEDALAQIAQVSGFNQVITFIKNAAATTADLTATKSGNAVTIKWAYGDEKGETYSSFAIDLTVDASSIISKAVFEGGVYSAANWDTTTNAPKSGATAMTVGKTTATVTKDTVASITFDTTPYFINKLTAVSFSPSDTVTTLGVGDVITSITPTTYSPTTAINLNDFMVTASSNESVIAKYGTSGFYSAIATGKSTLTISSVDGSVTYTMEVTVEASSPLSLNGSYSGTLTDSNKSAYITTMNFANGMVVNGNINCGEAGFNMDFNEIELTKSGDSWVLTNENTVINSCKITAFSVTKAEDGSLTIDINFTDQSDNTTYALSGSLTNGAGFAYAGSYSGTVTGDNTSLDLSLTINSDKSFTLTGGSGETVTFNVAGTIATSDDGLTVSITSNADGATYQATAITMAESNGTLTVTIAATKGTDTANFTGSFAIASSGTSINDFVGTYSAKVADDTYKLTLEIGKEGVSTLKVTKVADSTEVGTLDLQFAIVEGKGSVTVTTASNTSTLTLGEFTKESIGLSGTIVIGATTITLSSVSLTQGGAGESSAENGTYNATITKDAGNYVVSINLNNGTLNANITCPNNTFAVSYTYTMSGTTLTLNDDATVHSANGGSVVSCTISIDAELSKLTFAITFKLTEGGDSIALAGTATKAVA